MVFTGRKWTDFVRWSTITQIESYPFEVLGRPTIKFILISSHFHARNVQWLKRTGCS